MKLFKKRAVFNSFVSKKSSNGQDIPSWYGSWGIPSSLNGGFNASSHTPQQQDWAIEEARIRGGYNNTTVDFSPRAYLVEDSNEQQRRSNALIYSGVFNSTTGLNETNVFSTAEEITKAVDPNYGSIQKIHALDSNLAILQENKISNALIDKDAIYSAEGIGTPVSSTKLVIGQITPYVGEYGISKNPESFAYYGYRRYFTDKYRGSVKRLSRDGLTEISQYGMSDFFRDEFNEISDNFKTFKFDLTYINSSASSTEPFKIGVTGASTLIKQIEKGSLVSIPQSSGSILATIVAVTGQSQTSRTLYLSNSPGTPAEPSTISITKNIKDRIIGGWDNYNKNYVLSIQDKAESPTVSNTFNTLSFEEDINGWTSFYTYEPTFVGSSKGKYYSFFNSEIYEHHSNPQRGNFYGVTSESNITFIFNANPSIIKNFKTVNYEGSNGWEVDSFLSDNEGFDLQLGTQQQFNDSAKQIKSYDEGLYTDSGIPYRAGFNRKENKYFANLINNSSARPNEIFFGDSTTGIKGYLATVKISTDATTDPGGAKELFAVSTEFVVSSR